MTEAFLRNKEEVLRLYGAHLWPGEEEGVRRERMKSVMWPRSTTTAA